MNEVTKACIAGVIAGAALFSVAKHANAAVFNGASPCSAWTDTQAGQDVIELGYTMGFADLWSVTMNGTDRPYRYGEVKAAITRECYRDQSQMIAVAAAKAMKTFEK
jgi:hypothetical protein